MIVSTVLFVVQIAGGAIVSAAPNNVIIAFFLWAGAALPDWNGNPTADDDPSGASSWADPLWNCNDIYLATSEAFLQTSSTIQWVFGALFLCVSPHLVHGLHDDEGHQDGRRRHGHGQAVAQRRRRDGRGDGEAVSARVMGCASGVLVLYVKVVRVMREPFATIGPPGLPSAPSESETASRRSHPGGAGLSGSIRRARS